MINRIMFRVSIAWWTVRGRWALWRIGRIARKLNAGGKMCLPTDAEELMRRISRR